MRQIYIIHKMKLNESPFEKIKMEQKLQNLDYMMQKLFRNFYTDKEEIKRKTESIYQYYSYLDDTEYLKELNRKILESEIMKSKKDC